MSSILTNNSAIVALQTLKGINQSLARTQDAISTGKTINTAKDNAAIWAISKVMESDISAFKAISTNLSTAGSTVATARSAVEKIQMALKDIKEKVIAAQTAGDSDRTKLQTDIVSFREQITSIVSSAQFNGVNLIDGQTTGTYDVLGSLDRSGSTVTASLINVDRQDLSVDASSAAVLGATAVTDLSIIDNNSVNAGTADTLAGRTTQSIFITSVGEGHSYSIELDDTAMANELGGVQTFSYVATSRDSAEDVARELSEAIREHLASQDTSAYTVTQVGNEIQFRNNLAAAQTIDVTASSFTGGTPASGGGMAALTAIDVSTTAGATQALADIETLLTTAVDAASALGSSQKRLEIQNNFVGELADLATTGVGALVDTNMEEASARLQALQTQQQLAIQSLSIANQAPSSIMALFRN